MPTLRPLRAALTLITCLLSVAALLATTAAARTTHSRKSTCAAATKSSHRTKRSLATRCVKTTHKKPSHKHAKGTGKKKGSSTVFLTPATCEDGSRPTRGEEGAFSCEDGSEPVCENGSSPILLSSTATTPMCRLTPGHEGQPGASGSECEGEECVSVQWSCEDESGKEINCEQLSEPTGEEAAEEPED